MIKQLLPVLFLSSLAVLRGADQPNIIFIMSDDMGYSDIGCYGSEIETPVLDGLAEGGLRFTQFYNTARCCPTRASLLTGLYPHQAGIGHMVQNRGYDGYRGELNRECVTVAEVLGAGGYRCYLSGKWHVTGKVAPDGDKNNWPIQRGFDRFYGTIHGAGSLWDPNTLTRGNTQISPFADPEYQPNDGFFYTDAISDHAARFIHDHHVETGDQPFFMYVSYTAAHWPMHARPRDIEKYEGKYDEGYEPTRAKRWAKMKELGLIEEGSELSPMRGRWEDVKNKEWEAANMEVYAAMVDSMDQGIGKIREALINTGEFDNTLILFFQDNGGCAENFGRTKKVPEYPIKRPESPTMPVLAADYLQPDMIPKQTRDGYPVRTGVGVMPGPADTYIAYGREWATVSNTPFKEYKHFTHEGGISTPLIAHWPKGIPSARAGELEHTPGHLIDLMATVVDLSGAEYPEAFHGGETIQPMEGLSLAPAFAGETIERKALYWEHESNRAIRVGDRKLVAKGEKGAWELYDLKTDRVEMYNLAAENPEEVEKLAAMWQAYAERARVLPLNPGRNSAKKK